MKLLKFTASNVYGYINFNINFNKDVSFLVGANGSGKSTAIKLIQAMFSLNLRDLISIPFEKIEIVYDDRNKIRKINTHKDKMCLSIKIDGETQTIEIPIISRENYLSEEYNSDFYAHTERELITNPIYKKIRSITPPVFLGLDRKSLGLESDYLDAELSITSRKEIYSHRKSISRKNIAITGSLSEALLSVQLILQEQYRKIREFEDRQSTYLRDSILKSSFKFSSFLDFDLTGNQINWQNKRDILKRREEITEAVKKIGSLDKSLISDINKFFDQVERLFQNLSQSESLSIEWLMNKAQIDRISDILEVIDDYNEKTEKMYRPINNFLQVMNSFFVDSKKKLEVDTVGRLFITRTDGKKCNIDILSSGERQLLVLIANVMLNKYTSISRVIIIDEPEISLHLKWQEKFSETILAINPETQFILATHSPDIVGEMTDKCLKVGV
ncbi:AAA family ATPase [Klebsiella oxytoca]|uniref:Endonuclease GajA/Old nuclease/RecF-like AAA domain-containing protein n=1 Tax=Klebsiella oxytoca TaxID=571 RepID=A0A6N2XW39_KLEOX|nr:AAA family ATPase [Klebsiella oxytoca]STR20924.1 hemin importer ATP-binding subunit [Klebsiella oxytoca]HEJ7645751.1 AAA family ATPase [Klebsiella oxytoca]